MYAVATLFEFEVEKGVKTLWQLLDSTCKVNGIFSTPTPHMSWFGAENVDEILISKKLIEIVPKFNSIQVQSSGLGIFTGVKPIIYLALVKTQNLVRIHKIIWDSLFPNLELPYELYSPDNWIPHITLAYGDVNEGNIGCAISSMATINCAIPFRINNISVIYNKNEKIGIYKQLKLKD